MEQELMDSIMKTIHFIAVVAAVCFTGCSTQPKEKTKTVSVVPPAEGNPDAVPNEFMTGSPPQRVDPVTAPPGVRYTWRESSWVHVDNNWIWVPGYWQQEQTATVWNSGRWENTERGWVWIPGTWDSAVGGTEENSPIIEMPVQKATNEPINNPNPEALDAVPDYKGGSVSTQVEPDHQEDLIQTVPKEEETPAEEEKQ